PGDAGPVRVVDVDARRRIAAGEEPELREVLKLRGSLLRNGLQRLVVRPRRGQGNRIQELGVIRILLKVVECIDTVRTVELSWGLLACFHLLRPGVWRLWRRRGAAPGQAHQQPERERTSLPGGLPQWDLVLGRRVTAP